MQVKSRLVVMLCSILCYLAYVIFGILVIKLIPGLPLFFGEVAVNHVWVFFFTIPALVIYALYKSGEYRSSNLIVDIVCVTLIYLAIQFLHISIATNNNFGVLIPSNPDQIRSTISVHLLFVVHGIILKRVLNTRRVSVLLK